MGLKGSSLNSWALVAAFADCPCSSSSSLPSWLDPDNVFVFVFVGLQFAQLTMSWSRWWSCDPDLPHKKSAETCLYVFSKVFLQREKGVEERERGEREAQRAQHIIILPFFLSGKWHDGWRGSNCLGALRTKVICWGWRWHWVLSVFSDFTTLSWPSSEVLLRKKISFWVSLGSQIFNYTSN